MRTRDDLTGCFVRACSWLRSWGHEVVDVDLDLLDQGELLDLVLATERRVVTLADHWEVWW